MITTLAGASVAAGDGGPALEALIFFPEGLLTDSAGNLYIADSHNHRVRKLTPQGFVTTVAGTGIPGFSGDGGPAVVAQLASPRAVVCDEAGNLYVADEGNARIRKITPDGVITTVAGTGVAGGGGDRGPAVKAQLNGARGVALDGAGNLYIADANNFRIRKVAPDGTITSVAGGNRQEVYYGDSGAANDARVFLPHGVALDAAGAVYFSELRGPGSPGAIRSISRAGIIRTLTRLSYLGRIAVDRSSAVYVAYQLYHRVVKVTPDGTVSTVAGTGVAGFGGDGGPAVEAQLSFPTAVALDSAGSLYISDRDNQRVRKVSPAGVITTVAGNGTPGFAGDGGPATEARLCNPAGLTLDPAGNLYIADNVNHRIRKVTPAGMITTAAGGPAGGLGPDGVPATLSQLYFPSDVAIDPVGNLYIADSNNHRLRRVSPAGMVTTVAGSGAPGYAGDGGPASAARLNHPVGIAVDAGGNLYIADQGNDRIRKITFPVEVATASPLPTVAVWTLYSANLVALGGAPP